MTQTKTLAHVIELALALTDEEKLALTHTLIAMGTTQMHAPSPQTLADDTHERTLEDAADVELPITLVKGAGKGFKAFTLGFGAGRSGAKLMIKAHGCTWDDTLADDTRKGAWKCKIADFKELGAIERDGAWFLPVSAEWVQNGRDKAQAKAERKAKRG